MARTIGRAALQAHGFTVKLIAPQFVKPYVKSNKNDANDAEAICEAMSRPNMRFVAVKTVEQQDIQAVHRVRAELSKQRKAKANQIRGLVSEYGLVAPKELMHLRVAIPMWLEDGENGLSGRFRRLLNGPGPRLTGTGSSDGRTRSRDRSDCGEDPVAQRLQQLRGVGPLIATALVATVGDAKQFANGRQMAASIGLTPRQNSSGGKERLLGISKRGDTYLRTLLIHGARSALRTAKNKDDRLSRWVMPNCRDPSPQRGGSCLGQQDGAHCLGDDEERHGIPTEPEPSTTTTHSLHDCKASR